MIGLPRDEPQPVAPDRLHRWGRRLRLAAERALFLLVWLAVIVLLSFGSAGLVAGMDHQPGTSARPELTWQGDEAVRPALESSRQEMVAIAAQVDLLGELGRTALAALAANDSDALESAIAEGGALVGQIKAAEDALRVRLQNLEGFREGAELRISARTIRLRAGLLAAIATTPNLSSNWASLTSGALDGTKLSALLARHDQQIVSAIRAAIDLTNRSGLKTALTRVSQATATLTEAEALRDRLRNTVDTSELDEWLRRTRNYDTALRRLYTAAAASPLRITAAIRAALTAEKKARSELPADTSGLVIIMADLGQGGANQAVIAIEQARAELAGAMLALDEDQAGAGDPSAAG